ncbi:MAG TPA: 50S ribosomal protein L25 [Coprothermobacter proteolyticus]|uniref:50S ribosomal protein L25 n=1 Tax=Coprothermobacter proteolyticus TaxID=35786 RepID=UPI000D3255BC|nr:50S ribosomal protein L25 [Coprothermobacter proteolyticus]MBP8983202.1 50S ribosomal protein L25 [Coprothermobacter sp.]NLT84216.1 50S ribosomal protein L25 [Coprothermobacter proteolyticus]HOA64390.1 50S ribosomal protein L25 [Coprothermobacter proteolyticus]HOK24185.1 50S ribosomal protein L25 [Coprothermobacter proteolyticus]HOL52744.1 50S ribosomal protein L25 [Coprothermobacter proteolyticus]
MAVKVIKRTETQTGTRKVKKIRKNGYVPAVLYGQDMEATPLLLERSQVIRERITLGRSLELDVDGKIVRVIVKEEQVDPISQEVIHLDFQALSAGSTVTVSIPIVLVGEPVGIKKGGILEFPTREIEVELPTEKLVEQVTVDVSNMDIGDIIHIGELDLPPEAKIFADLEEVVVAVTVPVEEEVEEVEEEAAVEGEPEVISKGKKEEEEEE